MKLLWLAGGLLLSLMRGIVDCEPVDNRTDEPAGSLTGPRAGPRASRTLAVDDTLEAIYEDARQAYLDENWDRCIDRFTEFADGYNKYKRMLIRCRRKCRNEVAELKPTFVEDVEDLRFYEKKEHETLCILKCNQEYRDIAGSGALRRVRLELEQKVMDREMYSYLHICYHKKERYADAANAVFTFLLKHPREEIHKSALDHYLAMPGVARERVVDLEQAPFFRVYKDGVKAYEEEHYERAVNLLERSLRSYYDSEEDCRLFCEGAFDQGWHPDFTTSIANHFTYCLRCKRACQQILQTVTGEYVRDLLRSHYHYLQFAYYKLGNTKEACAATESYLLFEPADETMLRNRDFYRTLPEVHEGWFAPREEASAYVKRQEYEMAIMRYISQEYTAFAAALKKPDEPTAEGKREQQQRVGQDKEASPKFSRPARSDRSSSRQISPSNLTTTSLANRRPEITGYGGAANVLVVAGEDDLGGKDRYMADGLLDATECAALLRLARIAAVEGDGYEANISPHSIHERFEGVTVGRAVLMVYLGRMDADMLRVLLEKTEAARQHVQRYFKLDQQLYFTYTHLVCRTALPDSPTIRDDLSHQIHADNCLMRSDGCAREEPAYTWRDFSAIVYLNEEFDGGQFFFAEPNEVGEAEYRARSVVEPRCGRMVAFSAGPENAHGVRAVVRGRRCAVALWFTRERNYYEFERTLADLVLERVRLHGPMRHAFNHSELPTRHEDLLARHFKEDPLLRQLLQDRPRDVREQGRTVF